MTVLYALLGGVVAGVVVVAVGWRYLVEAMATRQIERGQADGGRSGIRRELDARRAEVKDQLGSELSPLLPAFGFEPADVRFLGDPAHFVVFAGHTAVKDRREEEMAEVVFVNLGAPTAETDLLDECVRAGRLRWSTLRIPTAEASGQGES